MLFIAGVSPKIKTLDTKPRICPSCGLAQAYLKRVDHYLSIFFIPVIRVKKGEPVLICNRCQTAGNASPPHGFPNAPIPPEESRMCRQCGRSLEKAFVYCPYCGAKNR